MRDGGFELLPPKTLRVFPTDADLPKDAVNATADESFIPIVPPELPEAGKYAAWRAELLGKLRTGPFHSLPEKLPMATESRSPSVGNVQPLTSEEQVDFHLISVTPGDEKAKTGTLLVLNPDEQILDVLRGWAKPYADDAIILAVLPRGGPPGRWKRGNQPNFVERAHALVGQTVDTGRVRDVAAATQYARAAFNGRVEWRVVGHKQAGVIAAYAELFAPGAAELVLIDPPACHDAGPHFLGVMRVLDVPDALGMLAPRKLTLVGADDERFVKRTAVIYQRARAADALQRRPRSSP